MFGLPPPRGNFRPICVCADVSVEKFEKFSRAKSRSFSQFSWPPAREVAQRVTEVGKVVGVGGSYGAGRAVSGSGDAGGGI